MPRAMPALAAEFARDARQSVAIGHLAELALLDLPRASAARAELTPLRVAALYEVAFIRLFVRWEVFLEQSFLRLICGYAMPTNGQRMDGMPYSLVASRLPTLTAANGAVLGGQDFVSWARPDPVITRSRAFVSDGPHEAVLGSVRARLRWFADIRNRVAHSSEHARRQFDVATVSLAGRRYPAGTPGRFLRDWTPGISPPERWLASIGSELTNLAEQISP